MKIAVTGDLHLPITSKPVLRKNAQEINEHRPDIVALAGDLGESRVAVSMFRKCVEIYRKEIPDAAILVVPGNHDLWRPDERDPTTSLELFQVVLPDEMKKIGALWLDHENYNCPQITVVGSYLHYDYSAKDTIGVCSGLNDDYYEVNKFRVNNDGNYLWGLRKDKDFAQKIGSEFENRLFSAQKDSNVKSIMVVTHVPCMECQMTRRPHDYSWSLGTPYFGNLSYEKQIRSCSKVKFVVSGHSHQGSDNIIERDAMEPIRVINLDSDYYIPRFNILEF